MHAVDFYNCANGIAGVNGGNAYCPNLTALSQTGINYVATESSMPSDSFPGLAALVSGGSPKTTGLYYDVAYDRSLDAPAITTGTGWQGGHVLRMGFRPVQRRITTRALILTIPELNGGAPGAGLTDGGIASIAPRNSCGSVKGCAPVYPWNFIRTNTIFSVVHAAGGYTAWIDKHASYSFAAGPGGTGLNDFYSPEVDSTVVPLPGVETADGASCATIRDPTADLSSWTNSFLNIQCYDALKVKALLNEIDGKTHMGAPAQMPAVFGMNFQAVYIGESLNEPTVGAGGYQNAAALPSPELLKEIEFVDNSIGDIVHALKAAGLYNNTLIIVTAKHGESPIDPTRYVADGANTPATLLGPRHPLVGVAAKPNRHWRNGRRCVRALVETGRERDRGGAAT